MKVGERIPDFDLPDQHDRRVRPSDYRGRKLLLSFHPLAWTGVCARQMQALEKNHARLKKLNTVALGLSVDPVPSKNAWARHLRITKTRLLSDFWPHGRFARRCRLFLERDGISARANILLDEKGVVIFRKVYRMSELPDLNEIVVFLQEKEQA